MESHKWHQLASCVAHWEEGLEKGQWPLACLDVRHFRSSFYATNAFQASIPMLELRGSDSEYVSPCVDSLRVTSWDSSSFFHWLNHHWFLQPDVIGTYIPGIGTLCWGAWGGAGTSCSWDIPPQFLSTTYVCGEPGPSMSVPLLEVWMGVVSLILQLSDFH